MRLFTFGPSEEHSAIAQEAAIALTAMQQKVGELEAALKTAKNTAKMNLSVARQVVEANARAEAAESALQAEKVKYVKAGIEAAGTKVRKYLGLDPAITDLDVLADRARLRNKIIRELLDDIDNMSIGYIANAVQEKTDDKP